MFREVNAVPRVWAHLISLFVDVLSLTISTFSSAVLRKNPKKLQRHYTRDYRRLLTSHTTNSSQTNLLLTKMQTAYWAEALLATYLYVQVLFLKITVHWHKQVKTNIPGSSSCSGEGPSFVHQDLNCSSLLISSSSNKSALQRYQIGQRKDTTCCKEETFPFLFALNLQVMIRGKGLCLCLQPCLSPLRCGCAVWIFDIYNITEFFLSEHKDQQRKNNNSNNWMAWGMKA